MEKKWLVCINDEWIDNDGKHPEGPAPKKDGIYRYAGPSIHDGYILLSEFTWTRYGCRVAFRPENFRPIDYSIGERVCESIERQPEKQLA